MTVPFNMISDFLTVPFNMISDFLTVPFNMISDFLTVPFNMISDFEIHTLYYCPFVRIQVLHSLIYCKKTYIVSAKDLTSLVLL